MFYRCVYDDYSHYIWAEKDDEAMYIASKLKMKITANTDFHCIIEYRPSKLAVLDGGLSRWDVMHSICFLSFLAHRQGLIEPRGDAYGDQTTLHTLIHFNYFGTQDGAYRRYIAEGIIFMESNVLGLPPPDMILDIDVPRNHPPSDFTAPFDVYAVFKPPRLGPRPRD